jgi:hypothetical protein
MLNLKFHKQKNIFEMFLIKTFNELLINTKKDNNIVRSSLLNIKLNLATNK